MRSRISDGTASRCSTPALSIPARRARAHRRRLSTSACSSRSVAAGAGSRRRRPGGDRRRRRRPWHVHRRPCSLSCSPMPHQATRVDAAIHARTTSTTLRRTSAVSVRDDASVTWSLADRASTGREVHQPVVRHLRLRGALGRPGPSTHASDTFLEPLGLRLAIETARRLSDDVSCSPRPATTATRRPIPGSTRPAGRRPTTGCTAWPAIRLTPTPTTTRTGDPGSRSQARALGRQRAARHGARWGPTGWYSLERHVVRHALRARRHMQPSAPVPRPSEPRPSDASGDCADCGINL